MSVKEHVLAALCTAHWHECSLGRVLHACTDQVHYLVPQCIGAEVGMLFLCFLSALHWFTCTCAYMSLAFSCTLTLEAFTLTVSD
jgi:hypothetical protein